ncbi:hypothetical protein LSH36_148g00048 [Paralvinella palmiformis]|uniref:Meiosis-specific with OB domain-containing protein n=1 Tax=Paralvinella palmiformis TaxID=53620 RepID=A0AAD9JVA2_9ANNE|nr:hypothetical protein LSH36_148g00048 [Paralvinella palmiformis]
MSWSFNFDDFDDPGPDGNSGLNRTQAGSFDHSSSSETITIAELLPGVSCAKMIGAVIAREEPRHFPSKKDPSSEHYLMSFTMRDSSADFINVTCWGGEQYIMDLAQQFHIADIVEVSHVSIQNKPLDGTDERYRPWTPSPYCLNVSENKGTVKVVTDWYLPEMSNLLHIPTKPENDYYTIGDVMANGQNLSGEFINVLAVVKQVGVPKEVTSKLGKKMIRCEVKLFDETSTNLDLIIWDKELIHFAASWSPKEHDSREAHKLYQYAQVANISEGEPIGMSFHDDGIDELSNIDEVYTVEKIKSKQILNPESNLIICGIIFAYITTMDIDADSFSIIAVRCAKCRFKVDYNTGICNNLNCPQGCLRDLDAKSTDTDVTYDLRLAISDHTDEFKRLSVGQKTSLKWKFLLERCKIVFKMFPPTYERAQSTIKIIFCEKANPNDVIKGYENILQ